MPVATTMLRSTSAFTRWMSGIERPRPRTVRSTMVSTPCSFSSRSLATASTMRASLSPSQLSEGQLWAISVVSTKTCSCISVVPSAAVSIAPRTVWTSAITLPRTGEHRTAAGIGYNSRVADLQYATVWETVADTVPANVAAIHRDRRWTWAEIDDAAARFASALSERGVSKDGKVALHLFNCVEYLVAQYAAFKLRAVAVNVNFRYRDTELAYVLDNSDSDVVVSHTSLSPTLERALPNAPRVRSVVAVDDGGSAVEGAERVDDLVAASAAMPRIERSGDDVYMLYTGGTTGMPKGVMYRHADHASYVQGLGYRWLGLEPPTAVEDVPV